MQLRVEKIASVQFRHDYFGSAGFDWINDWPETYNEDFLPIVHIPISTEIKLKDWGLFYRKTTEGFDLFAKIREDSDKFYLERTIEKNTELYFFIIQPINNWPQFTRKIGEEKGLTVFSNLNGYKAPGAGSEYYLHNEILDSFDGVKIPGQLVRKGNKVYEALERTNTKPPGSKWIELGNKVDFTTLSSKIDYCQQYLRVSSNSLAGKTIAVKDVYNNVVFSKTFDGLSTEKETSVDLSNLQEGIYTYELNAVQQGTFFLSQSLPQGTFGLIQIALQNKPAIIPAPNQLDEEWLLVSNGSGSLDNQEINPREFVVHFLPNRANWKYIFSREIDIEMADVTAAGYQKLSNTEFVSNDPIIISRTAQGADFGLDQRLPAANASLLIPQLNASDEIKSYVSEIHVNV